MTLLKIYPQRSVHPLGVGRLWPFPVVLRHIVSFGS